MTTIPAVPAAPARPRRNRPRVDVDVAERDRILAFWTGTRSYGEIARLAGRHPSTVQTVCRRHDPDRYAEHLERAREAAAAESRRQAEERAAREREERARRALMPRRCARCGQLRAVSLYDPPSKRTCVYCVDANPLIPTYPLVAALGRLVAHSEHDWMTLSETLGNWSGSGSGGGNDSETNRATWERRINRWRSGSSATEHLWTVEDALDGAGLFWWEVYNERTVRYCVRVETTRKDRPRLKDGHAYYEVVARRRVGDLGPNLAELARIRRAFEGPPILDDADDLHVTEAA
jgi:hypothetical protein